MLYKVYLTNYSTIEMAVVERPEAMYICQIELDSSEELSNTLELLQSVADAVIVALFHKYNPPDKKDLN